MTATTVIQAEAQKAATSAVVELFQIDLRPLGGELLRLCSTADHAGPVHFGGVTYSPTAIEAEGWRWDGQGTPPTPTIKIEDVSGAVTALTVALGHPLGAPVTRIRTYARYLDSGLEPDPDQHWPLDKYKISRAKEFIPGEYYTYELAPRFTMLEGGKFPRRQVLKDYCGWVYRTWDGDAWDYSRATCPYSGLSLWDADGNRVSNPALDQCDKRLTGCRKRFGGDPKGLPFGGFPGLTRS